MVIARHMTITVRQVPFFQKLIPIIAVQAACHFINHGIGGLLPVMSVAENVLHHRQDEEFSDIVEQTGEEGDGASLCAQMRQHVVALVEVLRQDQRLPVSLEEQLDEAAERGDAEEVERLRLEMIRQTVDEGEDA